MRKTTFTFILFVLAALSSAAQSPLWTTYNTSNSNLPSNTIRAISIDTSGTKWIGTDGGGLAKLDGSNWTIYNVSNSNLPHNSIRHTAIDENNNLWIGTNGGGLAMFNGTTWTVYDTSNSGLPGNMVTSTTFNSNGDKWIGTENAGLAFFNNTNWTVYNTSNSGLPSNMILSITVAGNGDLWIGTDQGLAKFNGTTWTVYNVSNSDLPSNQVRFVYIDGNNDKWIGTYGGGLAVFDNTVWEIYDTAGSAIPHNNLLSIVNDSNDVKWIGTYGGGLAKFDNTNWVVYNTSNSGLPNNMVYALDIGAAEEKWIGTANGLAMFENEMIDIGIQALILPTDSVCGHLQQGIQVRLRNDGNVPVTGFTVTSRISGAFQTQVVSNFSDTLHPGDSTLFTVGTFNSVQGGNIQILTYLTITNDDNSNNDTLITLLYISPKPPMSNVLNDSVCSGGIVTLSGINTNNLTRWYHTSTATTEFHTGASFITPVLTTNTNYYIANYTAHGCLSERQLVTVTVLALPVLPNLVKGTLFEGTFNTGTQNNPDVLCAQNKVSYEVMPPVGFTNNEFGSKWTFTTTLITMNGHTATNFNMNLPTANNNATITYNSDFSDGDSMLVLNVVYTLLNTQCTSALSRYITVHPSPVVSFTTDRECINSPVSFTNTSSVSSGSITGYVWDFGDGNTSMATNPQHAYASINSYIVKLTAITDFACSNEMLTTIQIQDKPTAHFNVDDACAESNLNISNNSTGMNLVSDWSFGNGSNLVGQNPVYAYPMHGMYNIFLNVTDENGCEDTFSTNINIFESPDARFTYLASAGDVDFTSNIQTHVSYSWDFGDGNQSMSMNPEHQYINNGTYDVVLNVVDANGCSSSELMSVVISTLSVDFIDNSSMISLNIFPNPFNDVINISYYLQSNSHVSIELYDLTGRKLIEIVNDEKSAGNYISVLETKDTKLSTGVYLLLIKVGNSSVAKRIIKS